MFFVISDGEGEGPSRIFFNFQDAEREHYNFIDVFNRDGIRIESYVLCSDEHGEYSKFLC
jgi:hypothetical protein